MLHSEIMATNVVDFVRDTCIAEFRLTCNNNPLNCHKYMPTVRGRPFQMPCFSNAR